MDSEYDIDEYETIDFMPTEEELANAQLEWDD